MKKLLGTTAITLALGVSPAFAQQSDIEQRLDGVQDAINTITTKDGGSGVEQSSTNLGNLINMIDDAGTPNLPRDDVGEILNDVLQVDNSIQKSGNTFFVGQTQSASDIDQDALNASNSANAQQIDTVRQVVGNKADVRLGDQRASNVVTSKTFNDIDQAATNLTNTVRVTDDIEVSVSQEIGSDVDQRASNTIQQRDGKGRVGSASDLNQEAANVGNSVQASTTSTNEVEALTQSATGNTQSARNDIDIDEDQYVDPNATTANADPDLQTTSGLGVISDVSQSSSNALNIVNVEENLNTANQSGFNVSQGASNKVDFLASLDDTDQNASNFLNQISTNTLETRTSQSASGGGQTATNTAVWAFPGSVVNTGQFGGDAGGEIGTLGQTALNAANSLTVNNLPNLGGNQEVTQVSNLSQLSRNTLTTPAQSNSLSDVVQSATNVANSVGLNN